MIESTSRQRSGTSQAIAIGILCGLALPVAAALLALLVGILAADIADYLNLGGDSDAFGEGADAFVIGAFVAFTAVYVVGAIFSALALHRAYRVPFVVPALAIFSPAILLVLVAIALL
jgi:hypothetical protein